MLPSFPALSQSDFAHACLSLRDRYRTSTHPSKWISVECQSEVLYIRVAYPVDDGGALDTITQRAEVSTPFVEAGIVEEDEVRNSIIQNLVSNIPSSISLKGQHSW